MPVPRYDRQRQQVAGPKTRRALLMLYGLGLLIGLIVGLIWVVAGLLHFHVF